MIGDLWDEDPLPTPSEEIAGTTFGNWTVVKVLPRLAGYARVEARCKCGLVSARRLAHLESGASTQCKQCSFAARQKSYTPEYEAWLALIQRCTNPKNPRFKDYGGRGITVCERWQGSSDAFLTDIGPRPSPKHSVDRIDNDGHYEPGNCRWATRSQQQFNRRTAKAKHEGART